MENIEKVHLVTQGTLFKVCTKCETEKNLNDFYNKKGGRLGKCAYCKKCWKQDCKKHHSNHKKERNDKRHAYFLANAEKEKARKQLWTLAHREEINLKVNERRKKIPGGRNYENASRRTSLLDRFPEWADVKEIKTVYKQAVNMTRETGIMHHVDHIIPLKGKLVSGLHVHYNLQILPAKDNVSKGNKFNV